MTVVTIKEINIPNRGVGDTLVIEINPFRLYSNKITYNYKVTNGKTKVLKVGVDLPIPSDIVEQWGTDDSVIAKFVCLVNLFDFVDIKQINDSKKAVKSYAETLQSTIAKTIK